MKLLSFKTLAMFVLIAASLPGQATPPPNVLVIMTDDLDARSIYKLIQLQKMPNLLSAILVGGMIFPEAFVTNSNCCPSRASFLTGQYSHNNGVLTNSGASGAVSAFDDTQTLPLWLRDDGYFTAHVGKYLNGYGILGETDDPGVNPFDERYVPPGWDEWHALVEPTTYWMYGYRINRNGTVDQYGELEPDYQTDVLSGIALEVIDAWRINAADKPFFLALNPAAPHDEICPGIYEPRTNPACQPFLDDPVSMTIRPAPRHIGDPDIEALAVPQGAAFNEADISDKPTWLRVQQTEQWTAADITNLTRKYRDRLASMRAVDDMIGALVAALGPDIDNTVIIFTSDNGVQLGEHRLFGKTYVYEESIKVPLFVQMPTPPVGFLSPRMVLNIDLAPTILELAQTTAASGHVIDGRSFVPLYEVQPTLAFRKRFLVEHWAHGLVAPVYADYFAVRTARFLGIGARPQTYTVYAYPPSVPQIIEREHYFLDSDPAQATNVYDPATGPSADELELESFVDQLSVCAGAACRALEDAAQP